VLKEAGPFEDVSLQYEFHYAQYDYQSYESQHLVEASARYRCGADRLRFGASVAQNHFFRDVAPETGPEGRFFLDWRRDLPLWEHEVRLRADVRYRWSEGESVERFQQRVQLQYRARIWKDLYASLEGQYRRDDFPHSRDLVDGLPRRTDQRVTGEVRLEYEVTPHVTLEGGWLYESQESTRKSQEYHRHQVDFGFSLAF
jgi:hypothetical protein